MTEIRRGIHGKYRAGEDIEVEQDKKPSVSFPCTVNLLILSEMDGIVMITGSFCRMLSHFSRKHHSVPLSLSPHTD